MVEFSKVNIKDFAEDGDDEDEPGEEVESAPPLKVGEEREIGSKGLTKKLLKRGVNWETPQFGDEVTSKQSTPPHFSIQLLFHNLKLTTFCVVFLKYSSLCGNLM